MLFQYNGLGQIHPGGVGRFPSIQWVRPNSPRWCGQISLNTMGKAKFTQVVWADFPQAWCMLWKIHPPWKFTFDFVWMLLFFVCFLNRDSSVVRAPDSWLKDSKFKSLQGGGRIFFSGENFLCWLTFPKHDVCWGKFVHLENLLFTLCECFLFCFLKRDSSVVRAPDSWLKDSRFKSLQGGGRIFFPGVNFLCWL